METNLSNLSQILSARKRFYHPFPKRVFSKKNLDHDILRNFQIHHDNHRNKNYKKAATQSKLSKT